MANIAIILAISGTQIAGSVLKAQDNNETGNDDVVGNVLISVSQALSAYVSNNDTGFKKALKAAADAIYTFLGLSVSTPLPPPPVTNKKK